VFQPFDLHLQHTDRHRQSPDVEKEFDLTLSSARIDGDPPLHPETEHLFDDEMLALMQRSPTPSPPPTRW